MEHEVRSRLVRHQSPPLKFQRNQVMKRQSIICYGTGKFAELIHFYLSSEEGQDVVGFVADKVYIRDRTFLGLPVRAFEEVESFWNPADFYMILAVGYRMMRNRKRMYDDAKGKGYRLANFVSKKATLADNVVMGDNNIVMPHVHVEPFSVIGNNNIFWSNTLICHHARIGHHNFFAPNSTIAGDATIGDLCFFGVGSVIRDKLFIADETHVVPGSAVYNNTSAHMKYVGVPARPVRQHLEKGIVIRPRT